jgi:predicted pyridoxine 5'-phosphate oxidase superfamily flavin-nucleotide-binding protein
VENIDSRSELRERYAAPVEHVIAKELDHLDVHCRRFIGLTPFLVLATSNAAGDVDASFPRWAR